MLKNRATQQATSAYASRFPDFPGNFRPMLGLSVSSIGIGTYLGQNDEETDLAYEASLKAALLGGINLIDTAVNYRFQRSERTIGKVLAELVAGGLVSREEVVVATKGGYVTFDGVAPADPYGWFEENFVKTGVVTPDDLVDGSHCMTPKWLGAMIDMSLGNLGLETIDIYYIHNPETQLKSVSQEEFTTRMRRAFELLEVKVNEGKIGAYGTATWNAFRVRRHDRPYMSLEAMERLAREVGGPNHHFRVIQLPYNLVMPEAFLFGNQSLSGNGSVSVLTVAEATDIAVCASASLFQGRLVRGMPASLGDALSGLQSDVQRVLQFVRSTPGVDVALVGMKSAAHVEHNLGTVRRPPAPVESLMKLFRTA